MRINEETLLMIFVCASLGLIISFAWCIGPHKCANYAEITGFETKFERFDGCYVKTKDGWILKEQMRDVK